jgi:hypothetical protein
MWMRVVWGVVLFAAVAEAKPLPETIKLSLKKGKPYVTSQGVTVQLLDNRSDWSALDAELSDDGKAMLVWGARCGMELDKEEVPQRIPMVIVDAKLDNAKGLALQAKRKYADAAKLFEQAWARDSDSPSYGTNLLAALVMSGGRERATKLLEEMLVGDHLAWFAMRLGVDPQLKKLDREPAAKAFRTEKPSKLTQKKLGDAIAESSFGFAAVRTSDSAGTKYISIVHMKTGKESLRLPLKTALEQRTADSLLASMGFVVLEGRPGWSDEAKTRAMKAAPGGELKLAADFGNHLIYVHRTTGCADTEFELHAGSVKVQPTAQVQAE